MTEVISPNSYFILFYGTSFYESYRLMEIQNKEDSSVFKGDIMNIDKNGHLNKDKNVEGLTVGFGESFVKKTDSASKE